MTDVEETEAIEAAEQGGAVKRAYVRSVFSTIAPRYDLLNHLLSFNIDRRWRRLAIAELGWENAPSALYIDVCAGTLDVATELARRPGFRGRVIGADFAEPMLRAGARKAAGTAVAPVVADALCLPFSDGAAAGAIIAFGIRNVADVDAGVAEVARVLSRGARFVILEFSTPRRWIVRTFYHLYFHHVLPRLGALISGHPTAYRYLPKSVANFPDEPELARKLTAAGFGKVRWRSLMFGIAAIHVGEK